MLKKLIGGTLGIAALALISTSAQSEATGVWLTESKGAHVQIYACDSKLCGKVVWLKEPNDENGKPKMDKHNEDESKRTLPIMGSVMIADMVFQGGNEWEDGTIYNAEDGNTYSSDMVLVDEKTLKVSGCVLFFCTTQIWTRV